MKPVDRSPLTERKWLSGRVYATTDAILGQTRIQTLQTWVFADNGERITVNGSKVRNYDY